MFARKGGGLRNLCFGLNYDRFKHYDIGWNYRYTNLQATLGLSQLKRIKKIIKKKFDIGNYYYKHFKYLKNISLQPNKMPYCKNIYWVFGMVIKKKSGLKVKNIMKKLSQANIGTRPFFWPMHKQKFLIKNKYFKKSELPNSEYIANHGFYIPSGLGLKFKELKYIKDTIIKILK